jgi:hypothetical protein
MSDQEWIDRVQQSRPEDLSPGDTGKLRDRSRRSPAVRKAISDEVRLDEALYATLGRPPLPTSQVVENARRGSSRGGTRVRGAAASLFGWLLALFITSACVAVAAALITGDGRNLPIGGIGQDKLLESAEDPRLVDDGSSPSDMLPVGKFQESSSKAPKRQDAEKSKTRRTQKSR